MSNPFSAPPLVMGPGALSPFPGSVVHSSVIEYDHLAMRTLFSVPLIHVVAPGAGSGEYLWPLLWIWEQQTAGTLFSALPPMHIDLVGLVAFTPIISGDNATNRYKLVWNNFEIKTFPINQQADEVALQIRSDVDVTGGDGSIFRSTLYYVRGRRWTH